MVVVVDNSLVLPLFIPDESSAVMEQLLANASRDTELLVPGLWVNEFGNGLLVCMRRGRLGSDKVRLAHQVARRLPFEIVSFPEISDLGHVHRVAEKHKLSFYDASYLTLAITRGGQLATRDRKLSVAAAREGLFYEGDETTSLS